MQYYRKYKKRKYSKLKEPKTKRKKLCKVGAFPVKMLDINEELSIDTTDCPPSYPCCHLVVFKGKVLIWSALRISEYYKEHKLEVPKHIAHNAELWHFADQ